MILEEVEEALKLAVVDVDGSLEQSRAAAVSVATAVGNPAATPADTAPGNWAAMQSSRPLTGC